MTGLLNRTAKCRGCGKKIAFIKTIGGKSIPVDPEPVKFIPSNDYPKFIQVDGTVQTGIRVRGTDFNSESQGIMKEGYVAHRTTCPAAEDFSRKRNKSERKTEK